MTWLDWSAAAAAAVAFAVVALVAGGGVAAYVALSRSFRGRK